MPEHPDTHTDLGAYVLGRLSPVEHARMARQVSASAVAREKERELREVVTLLRQTTPSDLPAGLEARTLAAVAAAEPLAGTGETDPASGAAPAADELAGRRARRRVGPLSLRVAAAALAALIVGGGGGLLAGEDSGGGQTTATLAQAQPGVTEIDTVLVPEGKVRANAAALVTKVDSGRIIRIQSKTLPVLPKGVYYELWFVGPGDTPDKPNRISGGTWHPDPDGTTDVTFRAAADPSKLPVLEITREPGDGSPQATLPGVLRSTRSR